MTRNIQFGFYYDEKATTNGYLGLALRFENSNLGAFCIPTIKAALARHDFKLGIDLQKPWEEIILGDYYQIEYLFVGELLDTINIPSDEEIGINIFKETNFGKTEFATTKLLNLTLIISRHDL